MWWNTRHPSTTCISPPCFGFSGFTSARTLSSSSTKSWESQTDVTPAWWYTGRRLGSWRRGLIVLSSTISSNDTMRQPTPSPGSDQAMNCPLRVCSCETYSSLPSSLRKLSRHQRQGCHWANTDQCLRRGPLRVNTAQPLFLKLTRGPQSVPIG
jgi:hypothetical protein